MPRIGDKVNLLEKSCFWNNLFIVYSLLILGMGSIGKGFSLLLVVTLAISSLMMVESAFAQSTPKPPVPEFTLKLIDNSYDVPPTSTVNPYTGKTETSGGYHVQGYLEVQIRIKNPPSAGVFYQVQTKGHFSQNWNAIEYWIGEAGSYYPRTPYKEQDYTSEYTILKYDDNGNLPREGQIDFRVQTLIGYPVIHHTSDHLDLYNTWASFSFNGTASDWSNIQTINMANDAVPAYPQNPTSSSNPTTNPTPTPTVPEFPFIIAMIIIVALTFATSIFKRKV